MPPRVLPADWRLFVRTPCSFRSSTSFWNDLSDRYRVKIIRTVLTSEPQTTSFLSLTSYPKGMLPPVHFPFLREAAILSRTRSDASSRSNWAKDKRTLRVRRPIDVVVLNCWVTETNETPAASKISTILAKSARDRV